MNINTYKHPSKRPLLEIQNGDFAHPSRAYGCGEHSKNGGRALPTMSPEYWLEGRKG